MRNIFLLRYFLPKTSPFRVKLKKQSEIKVDSSSLVNNRGSSSGGAGGFSPLIRDTVPHTFQQSNLAVVTAKQEAAVERQARRTIDVDQLQCPTSTDRNAVTWYKNYANDELFLAQWYLQDCRPEGSNLPYNHINVVNAWRQHNVRGRNIVVVVIDDGLETDHLDLKDRYDENFSYDFIDDDTNPYPNHIYKKWSHGTRCAGVIAMKGGNKICGVGIAPEVTLGAIRLLGPAPSADSRDAAALLFKHKNVHIMSNSWGPNDDGKTASNMGDLTRSALKTGVQEGRNKYGILYIFAGGNGKPNGDMCGCDPFVGSIFTMAVASCDYRGMITRYSERCASIMVTAYSGDRSTAYNVITTDVGDSHRECTIEHSGTSAAAPMLAGAAALVLEARPDLSWRDFQHLLVWTSEIAPLRGNTNYKGWVRNKASIYYSSDFGFGLLDVNKMVTMAKSFEHVPPMSTCVRPVALTKMNTKISRAQPFSIQFFSRGCKYMPAEIKYIEHVSVVVSLSYTRRGDLQITLTSPSGAKVHLLEERINDATNVGFTDWTFDSLHAWGETPYGQWTVEIYDEHGSISNQGSVEELTLVIYGTKDPPPHYKERRTYYNFKPTSMSRQNSITS